MQSAVQSLSQCHTGSTHLPRSLWTLGFRCCRAVFVSKNVNPAMVSLSVYSHSTQRVVEQSCLLALHISSTRTSWTPRLQHTNRFHAALRIICGLSTNFNHDYVLELPISGWQSVCQPFFVPMVRARRPYGFFYKIVFSFVHPNFLSSFSGLGRGSGLHHL